MNAYNQASQTTKEAKLPEVARQPVIEQSLQTLEKQVEELSTQCGRCVDRLAPIVSPLPAVPDKTAETESTVPLANRIDSITRKVFKVTTLIREVTNQIEL